MPHTVFISHATPDGGFVESEILPALTEWGLSSWYSPEQLPTGARFQQEIHAAINQCEWFLIVLSPHSIQSPWVQAEVGLAIEHRRDRVIPVLIQDCNPAECHLQLPGYHMIDWFPNRDHALSKLKKKLLASDEVFPASHSEGFASNLIGTLRTIRESRDSAQIGLVFRSLASEDQAIRDRARQALHAIGWKEATQAIAKLPLSPVSEIEGILDGLAALESHIEVVEFLDQLSNRLTGDARNRAILLWERKTLALRREKMSQVFQSHHSPLNLVKVLGQGLTAATFLAEHAYMGEKQVVVRMLRPELASRHEIRFAFLELTQTACGFVHENLVMIRDTGRFLEAQMYYYVRDYIPGATLQDMLNKGQAFSPQRICGIVRQIASALRPIHEQGISHGGIKPSNVFLTDKNRVILGDFSLPLQLLGHDMQRLSYDFRYAAPEQFFHASPVSPAADFYSLGCLFYELACGQPPFVSDSAFELVSCHTAKSIPLASTCNSVFGTLADDLIQRLLNRTPDERPQTLDEVYKALDFLEQSLDETALPALPPTAESNSVQQFVPQYSIAGFQNPGDVFQSIEILPNEPVQLPEQSSMPPRMTGGTSIQQFLTLLKDHGLVNGDIPGFFEKSGADHPQSEDAWPLIEELIRQGQLTQYQAQTLYQGRQDPLEIANYIILERIGQGGMGMVFRARHYRMKRIVAIKVIPASVFQNATVAKRFLREVEAQSRLSHPNIVTALDAGEDADKGFGYLVMEYVDGQDLTTLIQQAESLPLGSALDYVLQAAEGLAYAHSMGIVHRDVKPSNLLLGKDGIIKILDLGLARFDETLGTRLTMVGSVMGTLDYMSPEQTMDSKDADHRADIYSLGCTLYYLLTRKPIYDVLSLTEKLLAHRKHRIPTLRKARADIPPRLDAIFQRMVAKHPKDRYQSMLELIDDLRALMKDGIFQLQARPDSDDSELLKMMEMNVGSVREDCPPADDDGDYMQTDSHSVEKAPGFSSLMRTPTPLVRTMLVVLAVTLAAMAWIMYDLKKPL